MYTIFDPENSCRFHILCKFNKCNNKKVMSNIVRCLYFKYIHTCTDFSKMHDIRTIPFLLKQVNNGNCITAVRGSLGYLPLLITHYLD